MDVFRVGHLGQSEQRAWRARSEQSSHSTDLTTDCKRSTGQGCYQLPQQGQQTKILSHILRSSFLKLSFFIQILNNCILCYSNISWGGVNIPQLTAIQAQSMTRSQKQEEVRLEINKLREQINAANNQLPGQGTVDLPTLVQKEAELTRSLTQTYL